MHTAFFNTQEQDGSISVSLKGDWVFANVKDLELNLDNLDLTKYSKITFACGGLKELDIAGAWVLLKKYQDFNDQGLDLEFKGFKAAHFKFLEHINDVAHSGELPIEARDSSFRNRLRRFFENIGRRASSGVEDLGQVANSLIQGSKNPSRLMFKETIRQISETGIKAIPIVVLISFLMGVVMAYQGAIQLQKFGASIFVVDLVAISVLREMGVLLAGIMVAGRSGSAFAAAIGVMNINEETDALRVMGLNPDQILIIPRVLGLLIALPLLTVIADIAGLAGGMLLSVTVLDISSIQFIERVQNGIGLSTFLVGLSKAPVFALLIACVSTLRGMQVKSSAEELGRLTTVAVVQSIAFIIIADGVFAVIYSGLGI